MTPQQVVTLALLAAKLAKETLALVGTRDRLVVRLQFKQVVMDLKALDEHIQTL